VCTQASLGEPLTETPLMAFPGYLVGTIASVSEKGQVFVDFPGNSGLAVPARIVNPTARLECGTPVVLLFDEEGSPIVVGAVSDRLNVAGQQREVVVDQEERIVFEAQREIVLKCGKGSITVRKDGRILLKGYEIVSRASGKNRIKGSTVSIN